MLTIWLQNVNDFLGFRDDFEVFYPAMWACEEVLNARDCPCLIHLAPPQIYYDIYGLLAGGMEVIVHRFLAVANWAFHFPMNTANVEVWCFLLFGA